MPLILTVDDENHVRSSIKNFLEDLEYDLIEAEDGESGLNMFLKHKPDLVLVDLKMPGMNGIELLTRILNKSPNTPVIVISGTGVLDDVVTALRRGAFDYLLKPIIELGVLQHAVESALEKSALIKENKQYQAHLETSLKQRTQELASIVNNIPIGLYRSSVDDDGLINMGNPEIAKMFGYDDKSAFNHIKHDDLFADSQESQYFLQKLLREGRIIGEEYRLKRKDSSEFWGQITAHITAEESGISSHVNGAIQDISDRKNAEADIQHKAYHDALTDLPNRTLLIERLHHGISLCQRKNTFGALLFIDLDHFKSINDSLGHDLGDELLIQIAGRMQNVIRSSDTLARLGGDEFVILLPDLHQDCKSAGFQAKSVAEKTMLKLRQPFLLKQHTYQQTASIGIVTFPDSAAKTVHDLLKWADIAMYNVKHEGRNDIRFFKPEMQQAATERLILEKHLHEHVKEDKFTLCYQPQTNANGRLIGAECLLRLEKDKSNIPPTEFVPIAEQIGLISTIGDWVMHEAINLLHTHQNQPKQQLQYISINVSASQFYQKNFIKNIQTLIKAYSIKPSQIMLEITETVLMNRLELALKSMNTLKEMGIQFSIDDFGTGYSSLAYLKKLPIDELKIDKSFIDDICSDKDSLILVKTIIAMAKQLNIRVVAEGIETIEQLKLLEEAGCDVFQGFYFSKPIEAAEFEQLLANENQESMHF